MTQTGTSSSSSLGGGGCPICKRLFPALGEVYLSEENVALTWVDDTPRDLPPPEGWRVVVSPGLEAHREMSVPGLPYGYVLGPTGRVLAKGIVNTIVDIHELIRHPTSHAGTGPRLFGRSAVAEGPGESDIAPTSGLDLHAT